MPQFELTILAIAETIRYAPPSGKIFPLPDTSRSLAFSLDGTLIAASDSSSLLLLDSETGSILSTVSMPIRGEVRKLAFSPTGEMILAAATKNGPVVVLKSCDS